MPDNKPNFKRYKAEYYKSIRYYQLPKFLFGKNSYFKKLSNDAKVLYSILRDRHELSLSNGWEDENHDIYLIYSRIDMAEILNMSQPTLRKVIKELIDYGLMEEVRQGLNKPNIIYLNYIESESDLPKIENVEISRSEKSFHSSETVENTRTENSFHSRVKETFIQESKKLSPNLTDYNQPDFIDNQSIYQEDTCPQTEISLTEDGLIDKDIPIDENINRIIKKNIGYNELKKTNPEIEDIYNLITDTFESNQKAIIINKEKIPINKVKDRFLQLNSLHIQYVLECVAKQENIMNIRSYLLTVLYNAPTTINIYYSNQANLLDNS